MNLLYNYLAIAILTSGSLTALGADKARIYPKNSLSSSESIEGLLLRDDSYSMKGDSIEIELGKISFLGNRFKGSMKGCKVRLSASLNFNAERVYGDDGVLICGNITLSVGGIIVDPEDNFVGLKGAFIQTETGEPKIALKGGTRVKFMLTETIVVDDKLRKFVDANFY